MQRSSDLAGHVGRTYESFNTGDASTADHFLSAEEDILGVGTDPREWWTGSSALRETWNTQLPEMHAGSVHFEPSDIQAYSEGSVGWFADQPTLTMPDGSGVPPRITGVLRKENGGGKTVQFHFSFGVRNEEAFGEELTV